MDKEPLEPALYLVSTPIGNLEDITRRAERILKNVDLILAEDTRHSRRLLDHLGIQNRMESFHDFNKEKKTPAYVRFLKEKHSIALISDAGTPGIADPGFYLVRAVRRAGLKTAAVPGPCAFIAALSVSGMPTDHFCFGNFPPAKSAQRIRQLEQYREMFLRGKTKAPTIGYYLGPGKVKKFLHEIAIVFGQDLRIVLARELTKKFEEVQSMTVAEHISFYAEREPRGEFVLLFHPQNKGS